MIGDGDLDTIFASGDFDAEASFNTSPAVVARGWFTEGSDAVAMYGGEVEAVQPSFTCKTDAVASVTRGRTATIDAVAYTVERIQKLGTGVSVLYLKTQNA